MPRVFISYVREDAHPVQRLAADLRASGIDVWIDKEQIGPGQLWKDEIRRGIASGDFFIACFSEAYAAKDSSFMNEELTQAIEQLRQRPTDRAWFIPVLLTPCRVPDRNIGAGETLASIQWVELFGDWHAGVRRVVRTIVPAKAWTPHELPFADGSTLVVLPLHPHRGRVVAISKYPITNAQYRRCLADVASIPEPVGENVTRQGEQAVWSGPFYPWRQEEFNGPNQPVVCVNFESAITYTHWAWRVSALAERPDDVSLPTAPVWDFAAYGTTAPDPKPHTWMGSQQTVHHQSGAPAPVDSDPRRLNARGVSDMVGNIWEWCVGRFQYYPALGGGGLEPVEAQLRGGSYLDDLSRVVPALHAHQLKDGAGTSHADLGFRIAVKFPAETLPEAVLSRLATCETSVADCWPDIDRGMPPSIVSSVVLGSPGERFRKAGSSKKPS